MAKAPTEIRSLARSHSESCIRRLAKIVTSPKSTDQAAIAAATALLDRGFGKPEMHVEVDETVHWVISDETMSEDTWTESYADSVAAPAGASESTH